VRKLVAACRRLHDRQLPHEERKKANRELKKASRRTQIYIIEVILRTDLAKMV
jgi:hypothetical protein